MTASDSKYTEAKVARSEVTKTAKVYSSRYRAKQKLYHRKIKPAKVDNPMALPTVRNPLLIKADGASYDGNGNGFINDGKPNERPAPPKKLKIPPPPNKSLPKNTFVTASSISAPRRLVRENKFVRIGPAAVDRDREKPYTPNIGNGKPDPGEIVFATVHWRDDDGSIGSKPGKRVLILGPVKGKPGVMAAVILTSEKPKDSSGRRDTTHIPVPPYEGDNGKVSLADTTQIIEVWPEDFEGEADKAGEEFFDLVWRLTELYHKTRRRDMRKRLRIRITKKGFGTIGMGAVRSAGKGYAADKMRGGLRIAQSMTDAERSARSKAGWKNRQRAPKTPKMGGSLGRVRQASPSLNKPQFKVGRTAADALYANPLGAYREAKSSKTAARTQRAAQAADAARRAASRAKQADLAAKAAQRRNILGSKDATEAARRASSRAKQAEYAAQRKKIIADKIAGELAAKERDAKKLEREKEKWGRRDMRAGMRNRLGTAAKELASQTEFGRGLATGKKVQEQKLKAHNERKAARKDLFDFVRSGDTSILDRYIPEEALANAQAEADKVDDENFLADMDSEKGRKPRNPIGVPSPGDDLPSGPAKDDGGGGNKGGDQADDKGPNYIAVDNKARDDAKAEALRRAKSREAQAGFAAKRAKRKEVVDRSDKRKAATNARKAKEKEQALKEREAERAKAYEAKAPEREAKAKKDAEKAKKDALALELLETRLKEAKIRLAERESKNADKPVPAPADTKPSETKPKAKRAAALKEVVASPSAPSVKAPAVKRTAPTKKTVSSKSTPPTKKARVSGATVGGTTARASAKKLTKSEEQSDDFLRAYALSTADFL